MFTALMTNTWLAASAVAVVAGVTGFFAVGRGSSFAAHALPNGAFAGAAGATLVGASTLLGVGVFSVAGALAIGALGRRGRHDVATALTVVVMLAAGSLFITLKTAYAPEVYALLFGQLFGVSSAAVTVTLILGGVSLIALALLYRPLLWSSAVPDVAATRSMRPAVTETAFLVVMALVTTMAVPVVGALLIFSLLVSPAAAARCLTDRPGVAVGLGTVFAVAIVWVAIAVSFVTALPVGFLVGSGGALLYAALYAATRLAGRAGASRRHYRRG
ncbi:MAG: metal ABC transporter permease [Actinomycetota bacterium]|nr:metal ABC transporter permease [Actinomycetota bacterium]